MLHCTLPSLDITSTISLEQLRCDAEFRSPRLVEERAECYAVRKNVAQPPPLLSAAGRC